MTTWAQPEPVLQGTGATSGALDVPVVACRCVNNLEDNEIHKGPRNLITECMHSREILMR